MNPNIYPGAIFKEKAPGTKTVQVVTTKVFYEWNPQHTKKLHYTYVFFKVIADNDQQVPDYITQVITSIKLIEFNSKYKHHANN